MIERGQVVAMTLARYQVTESSSEEKWHEYPLLGSGGREHALVLKLTQSPKCNKLFAAPEPGIAGVPYWLASI